MNKKIMIVGISLVMLAMPAVIFAVTSEGLDVPTGVPIITNIGLFINAILDFIWPVFVGIAILMFIVAGFMFITANGDPGKISTARHAVIWAIVGVIVAMLAFSSVSIITRIITSAAIAPGSVGTGGACTQNADCSGTATCNGGVCS